MIKEQRKDISKHIKSQKGQKYPCGNQVVCCGYFSYKEDWEKFCKKNKYFIEYKRKDSIKLKNNEIWRFFNLSTLAENIRGFRFYKITIDKSINPDLFYNYIYPCCIHYCKKIKWIGKKER